MRVLHVISRMNQGGTATYLENLISGLNQQGIDNLLAFGRVTEDEMESQVVRKFEAIRLNHLSREISVVKDYKSRVELSEVIEKFRPQIVHSHAFKAGLIARTTKRFKSKRVHTFHGHHLYDPEFGALARFTMNNIEKFLQKYTDATISVGAKVGQELQNVGAIRGSFVSIPPGINRPHDTPRDMAMKLLGLENSSNPIVGWLGRFVDVKRPEFLLDLAKLNPKITFLAAGDGPLLSQLRSSQLPNLILPGWQDSSLILSASDMFISTSRSEGMPLALIEAQRFGIPTIAPDVGSISEIIEDKETGFLARADLSDLSPLIQSLAFNSLERKRMSINAVKKADEKFSIQSMVEKHSEVYESLLC